MEEWRNFERLMVERQREGGGCSGDEACLLGKGWPGCLPKYSGGGTCAFVTERTGNSRYQRLFYASVCAADIFAASVPVAVVPFFFLNISNVFLFPSCRCVFVLARTSVPEIRRSALYPLSWCVITLRHAPTPACTALFSFKHLVIFLLAGLLYFFFLSP